MAEKGTIWSASPWTRSTGGVERSSVTSLFTPNVRFIEITEEGSLAITIEGIDHVIALSRSSKVEKLLIGQTRRDGE